LTSGRRLRSITVAALIVFTPSGAAAQTPSLSVSAGFGVDTTITDVHNVFSLVRAYLARPDTSARTRGLWTSSTEFDRRIGDVTAGRVYQGFPATLVGVIPAVPNDSVYVVRILYARADSAQGIGPLALQRLYAVRERGSPFGFRLSGALPRMTEPWARRTKGSITFWYAPGTKPNQAKIDSGAYFVDSVAMLFKVPAPRHLDVYIGSSMDDVYRAIGIDFFPEPSGPGLRSGGLNIGSILLVGNSEIGEAYFHEFVHSVLGPNLPQRNGFINEGVATWLGGSRQRTAKEMYALLHKYQTNDSTLTLSGLFRSGFSDSDQIRAADLLYGSGALVANAVFRKSGIAGVRRLFGVSGDADAILRAIATELGLPTNDPAAIDRWWREEAARASQP